MLSQLTKTQLRHIPATGGQDVAHQLHAALGKEFALWDLANVALLQSVPSQPGNDDPVRGDLVRALGAATEPQVLSDEDFVVLLAIPLLSIGMRAVAVAPFATRPVGDHDSLQGAARLLNLDESATRAWINHEDYWSPKNLCRIAKLVLENHTLQRQTERLQTEVVQVSDNLANTYEEICLLHAVTQNLQISSDDASLAQMAVNRLLDSLPLEGCAVQLLPVARAGSVTYTARTESTLISTGNCPVDDAAFTELIETLKLDLQPSTFVANEALTAKADWPFPNIKQVVIVPVGNSERVYGYLAAFNHNAAGNFGSVEASLLNSVASMLGTHASNRDLYRQQTEFLASVVRAMSSAIDAKDPYTCGHSDRVARVSVRLAQELGCEQTMLHTLYMAGLLHDVGKIGIRDEILSKPARLSDEEYEHIKQHPGLGYRILADIKPLKDVLPAVLHHHEMWDGNGYPCALMGEQIPLIARIVAVADAYDAMSSDRPYRKGMPIEKVDEIFRQGSGSHWDPEVVAAFFAAHDDILALSMQERANLTLDVRQWT